MPFSCLTWPDPSVKFQKVSVVPKSTKSQRSCNYVCWQNPKQDTVTLKLADRNSFSHNWRDFLSSLILSGLDMRKEWCKPLMFDVPLSYTQLYITCGRQRQSDWCSITQIVLPNFSQEKFPWDSHEYRLSRGFSQLTRPDLCPTVTRKNNQKTDFLHFTKLGRKCGTGETGPRELVNNFSLVVLQTEFVFSIRLHSSKISDQIVALRY